MNIEHMVVLAQQGDAEIFSEICKRFTGLVKKSASQAHLRPIYEEAVSVGYLALVEAIQSFDIDLKVSFAGYAQSKIKFAMWNLFKRERNRWQHEAALEAEQGEAYSLLDNLMSDIDIAKEVEIKCLGEDLLQEMERLPAKQRQAILLTLVSGMSLTETAKLLGITPQAVYNLKNRGIEKVQRCMYRS